MNGMPVMPVALAGWINRQQQDAIGYLREEVRAGEERKFLFRQGAATGRHPRTVRTGSRRAPL